MSTTLIRRVFDLPYHDAADMFANFAHTPYSVFFDSSDQNHPDAKYSFIGFDPTKVIAPSDENPFGKLREFLTGFKVNEDKSDLRPSLPFCGGLAGLLGYDVSKSLEHLPDTAKPEFTLPNTVFGLYINVIAYDRVEQKCWFICHNKNAGEMHKKVLEHISSLDSQTERLSQNGKAISWQSNFTQKAYESAVQKVKDYILAGDIFQANIAQRFTAQIPENFNPYNQYLHLRRHNPAPFSGYMNCGQSHAILCSSPERFLKLRNGTVETKPIKGTIPRDDNPDTDQANKAALLSSTKNRAENIMIVDLLRNDLSKVCTPEGIKVDKLCEIETFAGLHHLVSTVSGHLQDQKDTFDLMQACFPGGSITGAPKIRAMEIIEEIEGIRRHAYCGALSYIDFGGDMDSNILIRTLIYDGDKLCFSVGGGITLNSDPADEYEETLVKANKIFRSFND